MRQRERERDSSLISVKSCEQVSVTWPLCPLSLKYKMAVAEWEKEGKNSEPKGNKRQNNTEVLNWGKVYLNPYLEKEM